MTDSLEPDSVLEEDDGPIFPLEDLGDIQTIILMRIYDVLMAQFSETNPKESTKLYALHRAGGLLTPPIAYDQNQIVE